VRGLPQRIKRNETFGNIDAGRTGLFKIEPFEHPYGKIGELLPSAGEPILERQITNDRVGQELPAIELRCAL
jgi:hypothetical protein